MSGCCFFKEQLQPPAARFLKPLWFPLPVRVLIISYKPTHYHRLWAKTTAVASRDGRHRRQTRCSGLITLPLFTKIQEHIRTLCVWRSAIRHKNKAPLFSKSCSRYKIYRDSNLPTLHNQHTYLQALSGEIVLKESNNSKQGQENFWNDGALRVSTVLHFRGLQEERRRSFNTSP